MTLEKLAKICGVSIGTVSKAFSGSKEISLKTKEKIFETAKKHGCYEKYAKIKFSKKVVAVIVPEIKSAYYCNIVEYIENELKKHDILTVISTSNFSPETELDYINYYSNKKTVDGIITINSSCVIKFMPNIPIVAIGGPVSYNNTTDCVKIDFESGIYDAVNHLKQYGHTRIAFIGEKHTKSKRELFINAINKNRLHLNSDYLIETEARFEQSGFEAMKKLLSQEIHPTAIITAYDNIALGAIEYLRSIGLSVPNDFSVIGMDDIPIASHNNINLSSIKTNVKEMCDIVIELLLKKLDSKFFTLRQNISVRSEFILRASVKNLNE